MRTYTIIGGVNGVGKSSFTGVLKECCTDLGIIIDVDKITSEQEGNVLVGAKVLPYCGDGGKHCSRMAERAAGISGQQ